MSKLFGLTVLLLAFSTQTAFAQERPEPSAEETPREVQEILERSGLPSSLESIAVRSTPELQAALDELSETLSAVAARIANDPELRSAAFRAAGGMLGMAQIVIAEQADVIQEALRSAADRLGELPAPEPSDLELR